MSSKNIKSMHYFILHEHYMDLLYDFPGKGNRLDTSALLNWYKEKLKGYENIVRVTDLTTSWRDGLALCCLIHLYRPELM